MKNEPLPKAIRRGRRRLAQSVARVPRDVIEPQGAVALSDVTVDDHNLFRRWAEL